MTESECCGAPIKWTDNVPSVENTQKIESWTLGGQVLTKY